MPIYEYKCVKCNKIFSLIKKMSDKLARDICPDCGDSCPRVFSTFGFAFSPYLQNIREGNMVDY